MVIAADQESLVCGARTIKWSTAEVKLQSPGGTMQEQAIGHFRQHYTSIPLLSFHCSLVRPCSVSGVQSRSLGGLLRSPCLVCCWLGPCDNSINCCSLNL